MLLAAGGTVCGAALPDEWDENRTPRGGPDGRVFQLSPNFEVLERHAQVSYNRHSRAAPKGIGIGFDARDGQPRIWIDDGLGSTVLRLDRAADVAARADPDNAKVPVLRLEVWGCGGAASDKVQQARNAVAKGVQARAAKAKILDWDVDRDLLVMAGTNTGANIAAGESGRIQARRDQE